MATLPATVPGATELARTRMVRSALWVMLGSMVLQGMLGIYLNLFVGLTAPSDPNAVFPIVFAHPVLTVHFFNALFLVALSAFLLIRAGGVGVPYLRLGSALLLVTFLVASYSGYHFVGTENNGYSFAMETGFFAALVLVVVLLQRTGAIAAQARTSSTRAAGAPSP